MNLPGYEKIPGLTPRAVEQIPRFLVGIKRHWKSDPIKSPKIEKALGIKGTEFRAIVSLLRIKGYPNMNDNNDNQGFPIIVGIIIVLLLLTFLSR